MPLSDQRAGSGLTGAGSTLRRASPIKRRAQRAARCCDVLSQYEPNATPAPVPAAAYFKNRRRGMVLKWRSDERCQFQRGDPQMTQIFAEGEVTSSAKICEICGRLQARTEMKSPTRTTPERTISARTP